MGQRVFKRRSQGDRLHFYTISYISKGYRYNKHRSKICNGTTCSLAEIAGRSLAFLQDIVITSTYQRSAMGQRVFKRRSQVHRLHFYRISYISKGYRYNKHISKICNGTTCFQAEIAGRSLAFLQDIVHF